MLCQYRALQGTLRRVSTGQGVDAESNPSNHISCATYTENEFDSAGRGEYQRSGRRSGSW
eukprot:623174-Rhodomonas_salina.3